MLYAMADPTRAPTFNHVAISVPSELLDPTGRSALLGFYGEVFGWTEMPTMSKDGEQLVLRVHSNEQFVFLIADEKPMECPRNDHVGFSVGTPRELYDACDRAKKYAERDSQVDIIEPSVEDYGVLKLHNFYVGYRLPMLFEVQCFEWAEGVGPDSLPD
jgi:hypothetical protein